MRTWWKQTCRQICLRIIFHPTGCSTKTCSTVSSPWLDSENELISLCRGERRKWNTIQGGRRKRKAKEWEGWGLGRGRGGRREGEIILKRESNDFQERRRRSNGITWKEFNGFWRRVRRSKMRQLRRPPLRFVSPLFNGAQFKNFKTGLPGTHE